MLDVLTLSCVQTLFECPLSDIHSDCVKTRLVRTLALHTPDFARAMEGERPRELSYCACSLVFTQSAL